MVVVFLMIYQTEFERDRDRELNQYKWVLRYYVILSHCNWSGTRILGNGFPAHSATYVVPVLFPLQCERFSIILVYWLSSGPGPVQVLSE